MAFEEVKLALPNSTRGVGMRIEVQLAKLSYILLSAARYIISFRVYVVAMHWSCDKLIRSSIRALV